MTRMFNEVVLAVSALSAAEQDAIAAAILAELDDERRWTGSFARSPEFLAGLAQGAREEHRAGRTQLCEVPADYAEMAKDEAREGEAKEWADALIADVADEPGAL